MNQYRALTVASLKMYFRNRQAIFWSLFFPFLIMLIFGLLNFDRFNPPEVGIDDQARNATSRALVEAFNGTSGSRLLNVTEGNRASLFEELEDGDLHAVFVLPEGLGEGDTASTIEVTTDLRRPQQGGVALAVLAETLDGLFRQMVDIPPEYVFENRFQIQESRIEGQGQGFKGFIVPGIAAMAIMQGGIFGVVFTLVRYRAQGVLRRLFATPINPAHFLTGQVVTRLVIAVAQAFILLIVGALILDVRIAGSVEAWLALVVFAVLGGALFISIGFAISGRAKNEEVAAPVSNIIAMPMMFLSGVFFPLETLPDALSAVTQYLPLTYLADGMRAVATGGAGIGDVLGEMAGLAVWTVISFAIATRLFKWE